MCIAADHDNELATPLAFQVRRPDPFEDAEDYTGWLLRCTLEPEKYRRSPGAYFLVDVRDATAYTRGHLRGSINLPLNRIKTRSFLRNKRLLLVSEGYDRVNMTHACRQLSEAGFANVKFLNNGLVGLLGMPIAGLDSIPHETLVKVSAKAVIYDNRFESWAVLNMSKMKSKFLDQYISTVNTIADYPASVELARIFDESESHVSSLLIADADGGRYSEFKRWYDNVADRGLRDRIFYLRGGVKAFDRYVKRHRMMLSKQDHALNPARGCPP